jgi:hypothetical protein
LRTLQAAVRLVIFKRDGGRWLFPVSIEATEPAPDDTLVIETEVGKTAGIAFRLAAPSHFTESQKFTATVTKTSSGTGEFAIQPASGTFPAWSALQSPEQGVQFQIMFTPAKRIPAQSPATAKVIIEAEDMTWCFKIEGKHPTTAPPVKPKK